MKSIFDPGVPAELEARISALQAFSPAQWGKMNAFQMVKHCTLCEEMMLGKLLIKHVFIGRLIGKMILKNVLKDDRPFGKHAPTSSRVKTLHQSGDFDEQRKAWIGRLRQYENFDNFQFVHPFFGPMTKEQIGFFVYKHADHHLRQFGV